MKKYIISPLMFIIATALFVAAGQLTVDPTKGTEVGMTAIGGPPLHNARAKSGVGGQEDNHYWVCQSGKVVGPKYSGGCQTKTSASGCQCYLCD